MEIIGLTGSIGMGKSLTASIIRGLGVPVFDSDTCVHSLLTGRALTFIIKEFPSVWDGRTETIDKKALGLIIFNDDQAKGRLEAILHPMVWEEQQKFIASCQRSGKKRVVLDIPLLFETGRDKICDKIICVTAPYFIQKQRVLMRNAMTEEKFKAILNSQMSDLEKQKRADIIIPTGLGRSVTIAHIKKALMIKE